MAIEKVSPANSRVDTTKSTRIPFGTARQKLTVPEIPGYHLHLFDGGISGRIEEALAAGYTFVSKDETHGYTNLDLAGDAKTTGDSDMGTRVSFLAGGDIGYDGQPRRLYLMKLPMEYHLEDMRARDDREHKLRSDLERRYQSDEKIDPADVPNQYVKQADFGNRRPFAT